MTSLYFRYYICIIICASKVLGAKYTRGIQLMPIFQCKLELVTNMIQPKVNSVEPFSENVNYMDTIQNKSTWPKILMGDLS